MRTTTYGTGALICEALVLGVKKIVLAVGGSATNDGGVGMAQALGARFTDEAGNELRHGCQDIGRLLCVDLSSMRQLLGDTAVILASDVNNVLCGSEGASRVYGPQKGANAKTVEKMDHHLQRLANILRDETGVNVGMMPGSGAAGGIAVPLFAVGKAEQRPGIDIVLDMMGFDSHLAKAGLVLTGEGRVDGQAMYGKVLAGIGKRCMSWNVPVFAFAGSIGEGGERLDAIGIRAVFSIANGPMTLSYAMEHAAELIEGCVSQVLKAIRVML